MTLFFERGANTPFNEGIGALDTYFLLEKDKWCFTANPAEAKIIPCSFNFLEKSQHPSVSENQILLVWYIETSDDRITPEYYRTIIQNSSLYKQHKKILFVHTNILDDTDPQYICHEIMFNRQKVFCVDYTDELCGFYKCWIGDAPKSTYTLSPIQKQLSPNSKMFFCPLRAKPVDISDPRPELDNFNAIKHRLRSFLMNIDANMYLSDPENGIYFEPNGWQNNPGTMNLSTKEGGRWYPAADYYYETSYINVGVESLYRDGNIFYPCEKSFDPFIKGNFYLLFAVPHMVSRLQNHYGFMFPDWIDYSFDSIENTTDRFYAYTASILSLAKIPLKTIHELCIRDKYILEHNRNVFFNRPYDSLYQKVKKSIARLGW